jgi:hypothetical protein
MLPKVKEAIYQSTKRDNKTEGGKVWENFLYNVNNNVTD